MNTKVQPTVSELASELARELRDYAMDQLSSNGASVVACFRNVVCIEHRMTLDEIDVRLSLIYKEANARQSAVYDLHCLALRLEEIGRSSR